MLTRLILLDVEVNICCKQKDSARRISEVFPMSGWPQCGQVVIKDKEWMMSQLVRKQSNRMDLV